MASFNFKQVFQNTNGIPAFNLWYCLLSFCLIDPGCLQPAKNNLFEKPPPAKSGIDFSNNITESDSVNLFVNEYAYMGGGVGIGDFNLDGLPDIFFAGSQVSSRLYVNNGAHHFTDVTENAGLHTDTWCTGVSIVDINNDGYPDIYVCVSGNTPGKIRRNLLFINNHNLTFTESAAAYGLDYSGYCTQAVFFDYDRDGDLDMYLLNHRLDHNRPNNIIGRDSSGTSPAADKLFCNTGIDPKTGHPVFKDVSAAAGIKDDGYGLGIVVSDFNGDHWPDIYVSNDYLANDELWLNNRNGTFTNSIAASVRHQSYSGMGADAADINNDGKMDLMTLDMMPEENSRKKEMFTFLSYERYEMERRAGYQPEFMRNMLQLNNGTIQHGDTSVPFFSEIAQLSGVSETDWSWSVLMADFDNDGWKDIHITNGMGRDLTNADFVQYREDNQLEDNTREGEYRKKLMEKLTSYKSIKLTNYLFHNNHDYTFSDITEAAGINDKTISNGAAYADLDNDGELDLVVNNINQPASVLFNTSRSDTSRSRYHYLDISLKGDKWNLDAIGSKITIFYKGGRQSNELYPVRGYLSSVDKKIHFGLAETTMLDSMQVIWPDDKVQILKNISADQTLTLDYRNNDGPFNLATATVKPRFIDVTSEIGVSYKHQETFFNDYSFQTLLPQKYSQLGPLISVADVNKDGLDDFFVGGAFNYSGKIFIQHKDGRFTENMLDTGKKEPEDIGSFFFDANGDGYPDLIVTGGSDEFSPGSPVYIPRLYINDGKGNFSRKSDAVPSSVNTSASVITGFDFDGDGNTELFLGGRVSSSYPLSPKSYILRCHEGKIEDVTNEVCPALENAGMVTSAVWIDFDNDKKTDLVIAGDWMPLRFFKNTGKKLEEVTLSVGLQNISGQWRSLVASDIDHDGDMDLIAGNIGLNNKYHVSPERPLMLFAADIDHNGSMDPVSFYYIKDKSGNRVLYPDISLDKFAQQVPSIKKKFIYHKDFGKAGYSEIYNEEQKKEVQTFRCDETRSCYFENKGNGKFQMHPLPVEAQFAPVNAIVCMDLDGDGNSDLLLAGNEYQNEIMTGRYDASYGLYLKGDGHGQFTPIQPVRSGFIIDGDVKDLKVIRNAEKRIHVLVGVNDEFLKIFKLNQ